MKLLPDKFTKNVNQTGKMTFTKVKRDGDVAMYERTRMDGRHFNYEVFLVKEAKAGASLPNGAVEIDRERYPGAESFGRIAYDCSTIGAAEERFAELVKRSKALSEARAETARTGKRVRAKKIVTVAKVTKTKVEPVEGLKIKGRKGVDRTQLKFPAGEWTMKQAHELNGAVCHATVYHYVKSMVTSGDMTVCGTKSGGRGKPTLLYRFSSPSEKVPVVAEVTVPGQGDEPF